MRPSLQQHPRRSPHVIDAGKTTPVAWPSRKVSVRAHECEGRLSPAIDAARRSAALRRWRAADAAGTPPLARSLPRPAGTGRTVHWRRLRRPPPTRRWLPQNVHSYPGRRRAAGTTPHSSWGSSCPTAEAGARAARAAGRLGVVAGEAAALVDAPVAMAAGLAAAAAALRRPPTADDCAIAGRRGVPGHVPPPPAAAATLPPMREHGCARTHRSRPPGRRGLPRG